MAMRMRPVGLRRPSKYTRGATQLRNASRPRVELMEDRLLLSGQDFPVTTTADNSNMGSLRWAIEQADADAGGGDTISFSLGQSGVGTINLSTPLPAITQPVTIDGTTEAGYNGTPVIVLNGSGAGPGADGLDIDATASGTVILGLDISGFSGNGITVTGGSGDVIQGDFIGTDPTGTLAAANGGVGILDAGSNLLTIGGTASGQGNVISGNNSYGIEFNGTPPTGNTPTISSATVLGNMVGADVAGTQALGNGNSGIYLRNATGVTIGGTQAGASNVISANQSNGVETFGTTTGLEVEGNDIGTDVTGTLNLGNIDNGVYLNSSGNSIGGLAASDGNTIAFNGNPNTRIGDGVSLGLNVNDNAILSNVIFSNGGLGINLGSGGNNLQPAPVLGSASTDANSTSVIGTLGARPNESYTVQFYANTTEDPSGAGQGQIFLGQDVVSTDNGGNADINATLPTPITPGDFVTATATDPDGNTSQFGQDVGTDGTADISVQISGPTTANVGDQITYTVTVTNNGPTLARGVTLDDSLPANAVLVNEIASEGSISQGNNSFTTNFGTLASGTSANVMITLDLTTSSAPSITDSATAGSVEGDPNTTNNQTSITTAVSPVADLDLTGNESATSVQVGQQVTYTLNLTNNGPSTATGVSLVDTVPSSVTIISASSTAGTTSIAGDTITTSINSLAENATPIVVTIVVQTTATSVPSITDSASVSANESDPDQNNNTATFMTTVTPVADLSVSVQSVPNTVQAGQDVTYVATLTNNGPSPATGISLVDTLPANVSVVSAIDSVGGTPVASGGTVTDNFASLASGSSVTMTIVVATSGATASSITDSATATGNEFDPDTTNNTGTAMTTVTAVANLSVVMSASASSVSVGNSVTYTMTVTNNGPSQATGVTLVDTLPANVLVTSVTASQGMSSQSAGSVTGKLGSLASGATATMTVVIQTSAQNPPSITNTAQVSGNELDTDTAAEKYSVTTTVNPSADLAVNVSAPTTTLIDQVLTYTVTATNNGPSPDTGITLTDQLPSGAQFLSANDSAGHSLTPTAGEITDTFASLASGASATLTIKFLANALGTLTDTANITGSVADPVSSNNSANATTTVNPAADLVATIIPFENPVTTGDQLTYLVTVVNQGPSSATNVSLADVLPAGATYVSAVPTQGVVTPAPGNGSFTASLGTLAPGASANVTLVVVPEVAGTATDTATVSASETDPNPANNTARSSITVFTPPGTLQFSAASFATTDQSGFATITVTRTDGSHGTVTINYAAAGGTAQPGVDYQPVGGTLTFPDGQTTETFTVPVYDNIYNNQNRTVSLLLASPGGGAVAGTQTTGTLTIQDVDPDLTPPSVQDVRLTGTINTISYLQLDFSEPLNSASAMNPANYHIYVGGPGGMGVPLAAVAYSAVGGSVVVLQPAVPLGANTQYFVQVGGVTDLAGNVLQTGSTPGFGSYFARGTNLAYVDGQGVGVSLKLTGGGTLDLTRFTNGSGNRLQVLDPVFHKSVLTGKVSGGATTLSSITGLGTFGSIHVKMTTPPFIVGNNPFNRTSISPPAVDVVLPTPKVIKKKAVPKRK